MPDQNWLENAIVSIEDDKKKHIPYLIFDKEAVSQNNANYAQEILQHTQVKQIIDTLSSDDPKSTDTSLILTSNLEIRPSTLQQDLRQILDRQMAVGYYVDLNPENSSLKTRLYKRAEKGRPPHFEIITIVECVSPSDGLLTKTEFYNIKGEKISDHYHLQFRKEHIDRDDSTDQLSADFYIHIISELHSDISSRTHPIGIMVEVGFTSDINGEMPMVVFNSESGDPLMLTTKPQNMSSSTTSHVELLRKYQEIAQTYGSQILEQNLTIELPD